MADDDAQREAVRREVDAAPPLTDEQVRGLRRIIHGSEGRRLGPGATGKGVRAETGAEAPT